MNKHREIKNLVRQTFSEEVSNFLKKEPETATKQLDDTSEPKELGDPLRNIKMNQMTNELGSDVLNKFKLFVYHLYWIWPHPFFSITGPDKQSEKDCTNQTNSHFQREQVKHSTTVFFLRLEMVPADFGCFRLPHSCIKSIIFTSPVICPS